MTLALAAGLLAGVAGAAELPARGEKTKASERGAKTCEIGGERGFVTPGGGCIRIGGYVGVGASAGRLRR